MVRPPGSAAESLVEAGRGSSASSVAADSIRRGGVLYYERAYALGLTKLQREPGDLFLCHGILSCYIDLARLLAAKKGFPACVVPAVVVQTGP